MHKTSLHSVLWIAVAAGSLFARQASCTHFKVNAVYDAQVANDASQGPTAADAGTGTHVRDISGRRRVTLVKFDLSAVKNGTARFENVTLSVIGNSGGSIVVYGVIEPLDDISGALTWNTAPGVQNNPTPAVDSPVALDTADLVGPLFTFSGIPSGDTRATSPASQALADFLGQDTDGIITLLFAPPQAGSSVILRSAIRWTNAAAGTFLEGDVVTSLQYPSGPAPSDKATDVPHDATLAWKAGAYAARHDVFLGAAFSDVNTASRTVPKGVLVSQGQDANTYDPAGRVGFGQTVYWRVDEVNAAPDSAITKGPVWSFTTEPFAYPVKPIKAIASSSLNSTMGPEKTIDGSGLNANDQHSILASDMWLSSKTGPQPAWIQYEFDKPYKLYKVQVWNSNQSVESSVGFGVKQATIQYSEDGVTWMGLANVPEFSQATGFADYTFNTTVDFAGVVAKAVKLTVNANWGGLSQSGLAEVRFFYVPVSAFAPVPANGATGVALNAALDWRPGRLAARHNVYLSSDANAVAKAPLQSTTSHPLSLAPLGLEYGRTYYWAVDEVNEAATPKTWAGPLWSFTTTPYGVVDDFESYDDACNRIFFTWVDGFGHNGSSGCGVAASTGNGTQSTVGNINPPFAERTIVNSGTQSMPVTYDNSKDPFYSEIQRQWQTGQTWTSGGADTLTLYFRGDPAAFMEISPGNILMSGTGTDIWNTADQGRFAYKQLSGDGSITAKVEGLSNTDPWAKAGVMIRESVSEGSSWAYIVYAGTNGIHYQARLSTGASATSDTTLTNLPTDQTGARAPAWVRVERKGNQFNGYYATDVAGSAWKPMAWNPQTITMAATVTVGLAVTSHSAGRVCGAHFSSVSTAGNVSGTWQTADWGVAQPTTGNSPATIYLVVQDSAARSKMVSYPDPVAAATGVWQAWNIPLSEIRSSGVDLASIKKLVIGVGDRSAPKAGSAGKLYIDDIRLTRLSQ
jgi:hypothetical protein